MSKHTDVRVYLLVAEDGHFVVAKDRQDLNDLFANEFGGVPPATRSIAVALNVTRPRDILVSGILEEPRVQVEIDVS